jgi:hypothetical protein
VIIAAMNDEIDKEYVKEIERKIEEINSRVKKTSTVEYTISDKLRMSAFDVFEDLYSMNEFLIFGWGLIDEIDEKTEKDKIVMPVIKNFGNFYFESFKLNEIKDFIKNLSA